MRRIVIFLAVLGGAVGLLAGPAVASSYCVEVGTPTGGPADVCIPH